MTERQFCDACRRLFAGNVIFATSHLLSVHHATVKDLDDALSLPCAICFLAWEAYQSPNRPLSFLISNAPMEPITADLFTLDETYTDNDNIQITVDTILALQFHLPQLGTDSFASRTLVLEPRHMQASRVAGAAESTGSVSAIEFLLRQYDTCRQQHAKCKMAQAHTGSRILPTRLLDITSCAGKIVLISDTDSLTASDQYLCLSHCWGRSKPYTLTRSNILDMERGIDVSALPRTFRDAVHVTRELKFKYLWIDCLCIIQNDAQDWSNEAGRMASTYSQAAGTIAATSSNDADGGLFLGRAPEQFKLIEIQVRVNFMHQKSGYARMEEPSAMKYNCDVRQLRSWGVEWEPLNQRAWVMQERQLSSRIMHFSKYQTFWECRETFTSENHIAGLPSWTQPTWTADTLRLKKMIFDLVHRGTGISSKPDVYGAANSNLSKEEKDSLYYQWCAFRIKYSGCDLTKDGDKLVALKGLADLIAKPLEDELVAGLWKGRISQELCWFVNSNFGRSTTPEPVEWRAPTWSWACSNALIWVSNTTKFHLRHESMSYLIRITAISVEEERSGALRSASLQVECKPLLTSLQFMDYDKLRNKNIWEEGVVLEVERSGLRLASDRVPYEVTVAMDKSDYRQSLRASLIIIQYCDHGGVVDASSDTHITEGTCLEGLILVPTESNGTFERVGLFTIGGERLVAQMMEEHKHTEMKVITLV